jgi:hypothetical protein
MSRYLVECACGNKLPVDVGQAGGRVTCSCGSAVDVPTLRKLRHLPLAVVENEEQRSGATGRWGARQGIMTASLIAVAALLAATAYSWLTQPTVPKFDPVAYGQMWEHNLEKMTPVEGWGLWIEYLRPLAARGFQQHIHPQRMEIERQIARRQSLRRTLWTIAAVFGVVAAAAALWPSADKTRRPRDKETRRSTA